MIKVLRALKLPRFEFLYVLYCPSFPWRFKYGFSWNIQERRACIEKTMSQEIGWPVEIMVVFCAPILYARQCEQWMHRQMAKIRCVGMLGSGKTEWFKWANFVTAFFSYLVLERMGLKAPIQTAVIILILPWPIDAALSVLVIALAQYGVIISFFCWAFNCWPF